MIINYNISFKIIGWLFRLTISIVGTYLIVVYNKQIQIIMKRIFFIIPIVAIGLGSCGGDSSTKIENGMEVSTTSEDNVNEMIEHMESFHKSCEGESMIFRASGERTAIRMWDNKYPKDDVDEAIEKLKETLLSDADINNMKYGNLITKGNRVIE